MVLASEPVQRKVLTSESVYHNISILILRLMNGEFSFSQMVIMSNETGSWWWMSSRKGFGSLFGYSALKSLLMLDFIV
jgi:hypothetical protein